MQDIAINLGLPMPERAPKEMLSLRKLPDGRTEIRINHSSYTLLSLCKRKAHYALGRGLINSSESPATLFGSAIHAALEVWYTSPRSSRRKGSSLCDDSVANMEAGLEPLPHGRCVRCAAMARFLEVAQPLSGLEPSDKRSRRNGTHILDGYFSHYADDPYVVLSDNIGPIAERRVELLLADESDSRVVFFGTIDCVLKDESTGQIIITDHKTTSALGQEFMQRISPNFQYTGYTKAFRSAYPEHNTRTFMSNGILVAKTKQTFLRQLTEVSDELMEEWRISLLDTAYDWWARVQAEGPFPMNSPEPCTHFGGCQYRALCENPASVRESIIQAQYAQRGITHE